MGKIIYIVRPKLEYRMRYADDCRIYEDDSLNGFCEFQQVCKTYDLSTIISIISASLSLLIQLLDSPPLINASGHHLPVPYIEGLRIGYNSINLSSSRVQRLDLPRFHEVCVCRKKKSLVTSNIPIRCKLEIGSKIEQVMDFNYPC